MEEEKEAGLSFCEIAAMFKRRIWWLLGIAVVVTLVAALLTAFVFSRGKEVYSVSFMTEFPGGEETYPDGTSFRYESIVYAQELSAVAEEDERFAELDIGGISSSESGIFITEQMEERETEGAAVLPKDIYTLRVGSGWFADKEQAAAFLHAVAQRAADKAAEKFAALDFSSWETAYERAESYSERMAILRTQYDFLLAQYERYCSAEAYASFIVDGQSLKTLYGKFTTPLGSRLSGLEARLSNECFILSAAECASVKAKIASLQEDLEESEAMVTALETKLDDLYELYRGEGGSGAAPSVDTFESIHDAIRGHVEEGVRLTQEIGRLEAAVTAYEGSSSDKEEAFGAEMQALYTDLAEQTDICKDAITALLASEARVLFEESDVTVTGGGANPVTVAVIAFVLSFLLAGFVFCMADYPKFRRERRKTPPSEVPAPPQAD